MRIDTLDAHFGDFLEANEIESFSETRASVQDANLF